MGKLNREAFRHAMQRQGFELSDEQAGKIFEFLENVATVVIEAYLSEAAVPVDCYELTEEYIKG